MTPTTLASTVQRNRSEENVQEMGRWRGILWSEFEREPPTEIPWGFGLGRGCTRRLRVRLQPIRALSGGSLASPSLHLTPSLLRSSPFGSLYCWGVVGAVGGGFHLRVIIPPTIPRTDPTMKPPKPKKPRMLKTSTSMPHVCHWLGLRRSSTADIVTMMPHMRPNTAIAPTKPAARAPGLPV